MAVLKLDIIVNDANAEAKLNQIEAAVKGIEGATVRSGAAITTASQQHSSALSRMTAASSDYLKMASAMFGGMLIDRGVTALAGLAREAMHNASVLTDLSAKTGLTISTLQRLDFVGGQSGVSLEAFGNAAYQLGIRLGTGSKGVVGAVQELHLNLQTLRTMNSDDQLHTIMSALAGIGSEQDRNRIGAELFGRQFKSIAASVTSDYDAMWKAAHTSGEEQIRALDAAGDAWDRFVKNRKADVAGFLGSMVLVGQGVQKLGMLQSAALMVTQGWTGAATLAGMAPGTSTPHPDIQLPGLDGKMPSQADPAAAARADADRERRINELKREAEAWQKVNDEITGRSAIKSAQDWMKHLQQVGGLTQITEKATKDLSNTLGDAIEAYARLGQIAPAAMRNTWISTLMPGLQPLTRLPGEQMGMPQIPLPPIPSLSYTSGIQGSTLPGQQFGIPEIPAAPKGPSFLDRAFGSSSQFGSQLAGTLLSALTGGGNLGKSIGGFLGGSIFGEVGKMASKGIGGMLGGALGSIIPGLGTMLGSVVGPLIGKLFGPTAYEKRTREEAAQRKELVSSVDMGELQRQAAFTGRGDLLQQFQNVQNSAAPEYLRGLVTDLKTKSDQLNAAMQRYGISWEQLGEKAKQSQIDEMAKQMVTDFQILTQAGASTNLVIEKMGGSVNELIQTSIRTGTEVPIALQPIAKQMSSMGLLVDATGAKIEVDSINWAKTMSQGFQSVVDAVNHLTQALGYELPAAAQAGAAGMNAAFSGVQIPSGPSYPKSEETYQPYEAPQDAAPMARGGIVRARPGGTLVRVGEAGRDEAIVPLGAGGAGGGTAIIQIDGRTMAEIAVPYIPGVVKRYRVGTL